MKNCPYCTSNDIHYVRSSINIVGWVMRFYKCNECGSSFSEEKEPESVSLTAVDDLLECNLKDAMGIAMQQFEDGLIAMIASAGFEDIYEMSIEDFSNSHNMHRVIHPDNKSYLYVDDVLITNWCEEWDLKINSGERAYSIDVLFNAKD